MSTEELEAVDSIKTYIKLKDASFKDGKLKLRIEWRIGPYSDHYTVNEKLVLNKWIKVHKDGPIKIYVKIKGDREVCAKAKGKVDLPWPLDDITAEAKKCIKL